MEFFRFDFSDVLDLHIQHKYYEEMSKKSDIVSYFTINCACDYI